MKPNPMQKQGAAGKSQTDARGTALSSSPSSLRLTELLRICLLAVASRYPNHCVDINEKMLGPQHLGASGWRAADLIEMLQETAPQLLQTLARLEVTTQHSGIYLLDYSEERAAFWVHCGGDGERMPVSQGNQAVRQAELTRRRDEGLGAPEAVRAVQIAVM